MSDTENASNINQICTLEGSHQAHVKEHENSMKSFPVTIYLLCRVALWFSCNLRKDVTRQIETTILFFGLQILVTWLENPDI